MLGVALCCRHATSLSNYELPCTYIIAKTAINYSALGRGSSVNHPIMFLSTDRLSVLLLSQCPMTPAKNITIVPNFGAGMLSTLHASFSSVLSAVLYATRVDHSHHHIMPLYTYPSQHLWKIHIHSTSHTYTLHCFTYKAIYIHILYSHINI